MTTNYRKILWIDDQIELLKSHIIYLNRRNFDVTKATNGPDALELIKKDGFDLILLDEIMPVMGGMEVLAEIKRLKPDLPVVMVTKNEEEELMEQAIGSQIDGFLTKPVNPSQILSVLKRVLDKRKIEEIQFSKNWAQEFAKISNLVNSELDADGWQHLHLQLCTLEHNIDRMGQVDLREMIYEARLEADRQFAKWVSTEYPHWIKAEPEKRPALSMDVVDRWLLKLLGDKAPVLFLVIDCLRMDQWLAIESLLTDSFDIKRESYFSIVPTATPYSRNALFSGFLPVELERIHPDLWNGNDEDEASSNRFEHQFLDDLLKRRGITLKPGSRYVKVIDVEELSEFESKIKEYANFPLTAMVYNFVDILVHTRQTVEVLKEMLPDEAAFREVTRAWFKHSSLFRIIQAYAEMGGSVLITSDHGSLRGRHGSKVIGDRQTSTSLRYKHGKNLRVNNKHAIITKKPTEWGLPQRGINTEYIFAKEDYYFIYPTQYHKYLELYKNSFQHGGISLDEMVLPVAVLKGKK